MDVTMQAANSARRTNATARELGREEPGKFGFLLDQMRVAHQSIDGIDSFVGPTTELTQGLDAYADESEREMSNETDILANQGVERVSERDGRSQDRNREASERSSRELDCDDTSQASSTASDGVIPEVPEPKSDEAPLIKSMEVPANAYAVMDSVGADIEPQVDGDQMDHAAQSNLTVQEGGEAVASSVNASELNRFHRRRVSSENPKLASLSTQPDSETGDSTLPFESAPRSSKRVWTHPMHQGSESQETSATLQTEKLSDGPALVADETAQIELPETGSGERHAVSKTTRTEGALNLSSELLSQATASGGMDGQLKGQDVVKLSGESRVINRVAGILGGRGRTSRLAQEFARTEKSKSASNLTQLPEDVDEMAVVRQLSDELKLRFGKNQTVEVNLNPAELGRVKIQIQMQSENSVNLRVSTEHAIVADLLNMGLSQLKKDLLAQGMQINQVEVNADGHNQQEGDRQQRQGNSDESAEEYESDERTETKTSRTFSVQA